jgi:hypothetical protein
MLNTNRIFLKIVTFLVVALLPHLAAAQTASRISWQPLREPGSGGAITGLSVSPHDRQRLLIGGDMLGWA